jgi:hypothetical protein
MDSVPLEQNPYLLAGHEHPMKKQNSTSYNRLDLQNVLQHVKQMCKEENEN